MFDLFGVNYAEHQHHFAKNRSEDMDYCGVFCCCTIRSLYFGLCGSESIRAIQAHVGGGDLRHWEVYSEWAPLGFYNSHPPAGSPDAARGGAWRVWMFQIYGKLLFTDNCYVHKRHDVYTSGTLSDDGKWIYTTNNASPIAITK
jgi:hypothetical protein